MARCEDHPSMVDSLHVLSEESVKSETRFQSFIAFAKFVGSVTLLVLSVVAWVGVMLLNRVDKLSLDYRQADKELNSAIAVNNMKIEVNTEKMRRYDEAIKRIESDTSFIRQRLEKVHKD